MCGGGGVSNCVKGGGRVRKSNMSGMLVWGITQTAKISLRVGESAVFFMSIAVLFYTYASYYIVNLIFIKYKLFIHTFV